LRAREKQILSRKKSKLKRNNSFARDKNGVVNEVMKERNKEIDPTAEIKALSFDEWIEGGDLSNFGCNVDEISEENDESFGFRHWHEEAVGE
jgi:hypothetical protein